MTRQVYSYCVITSNKHHGKSYGPDLEKLDVAPLSSGRAEVFDGTITEIAAEIDAMTGKECLTVGFPKHDDCYITTKDKELPEAERGGVPIIARSVANFDWPDCPAVLVLDHDPDHWTTLHDPLQSVDEVIAAVGEALGVDMGEVDYLAKPSSSSYIYDADGVEVQGFRGAHLYIGVASLAPLRGEGGRKLIARMELAGFGSAAISASGSVLRRGLVDAATVSNANGVVFAGEASFEGGHTARRNAIVNEGAPLDLGALVDDVDVAAAEIQWQALKADMGGEAAQVEAEYRLARKAENPELTDAMLDRALAGGDLPGEWDITFDDWSVMSLADLFAAGDEYHGKTCRDPLEPEYGASNTQIFITDDGVTLHSFAHGSHNFYYRVETPENEDDGTAALAAALNLPPPQWGGFPQLVKAHLPDLQLTAESRVPKASQLCTRANVDWAASRLGITVRFNMMTNRRELSHPHYTTTGDMQLDLTWVIIDELTRLGITGDNRIKGMLDSVSLHHSYHPFEDYLDATVPDGKDHIADLIATITSPSPLTAVYIRKWLIQVVAGVRGWRNDGTQLPHVLVLSGGHGVGKSTWFKNLIPAEFFKGEAALHLNGNESKDSKLAALRTVITELSEIETTFGKSAMGALKSFISTEVDEIRRPYAPDPILAPRTTSFCGSVNTHQFLVDSTGNRRFWPLEVEAIDWGHSVDFDQVWAQAAALEAAGESFYLSGDELKLHVEMSEQHRGVSDVEDAFYAYFDDDLLATPERDWVPVRTTEVFSVLEMKGASAHPAAKGEMSELLTRHFGHFRKIGPHQKVRMMPIRVPDLGMIRAGKDTGSTLKLVAGLGLEKEENE